MQNRNPVQVIERLWPQVMRSPELIFHQLDLVRNAGLFIQMPPGAYRSASFLDGRTFTPQMAGAWIPLTRVEQTVMAAAPSQAPLHYIFHMGHTGSTLLSRLLDETGIVHPLREPMLLRNLAEVFDHREHAASLVSPGDADQWLEIAIRLWSRIDPPAQLSVLKATSSCARLGVHLLKARDASRAVYLSMAPEPFMAAILCQEGSLLDIRGHATERIRRLSSLGGPIPGNLYELSPGELVAASWLSEALTRELMSRELGERVLLLDFDEMLADLPSTLERVLQHLGLPFENSQAERLAKSPVLRQYSKAPDHEYSANLRQQMIEESRQQNRVEIERGLTFLKKLRAPLH